MNIKLIVLFFVFSATTPSHSETADSNYCPLNAKLMIGLGTQNLIQGLEGAGRFNFSANPVVIKWGNDASPVFKLGTLDCRAYRSSSESKEAAIEFKGFTNFQVRREGLEQRYTENDCANHANCKKLNGNLKSVVFYLKYDNDPTLRRRVECETENGAPRELTLAAIQSSKIEKLCADLSIKQGEVPPASTSPGRVKEKQIL